MRGATVLLVLAALAATAAAPPAAGDQPIVGSPVCGEGALCAPSGACLEGIACQPTVCDPATDCAARVATASRCERNLTIDGQTCVTRAEAGASAGGRAVPVPAVHVVPGTPLPGTQVPVPGSSAAVEADLAEGFVRDRHLPNQWAGHDVTLRLVLADVDLGATSVSLYHQRIGPNETSPHDYALGAASARHESAFTAAGAGLGVLLLDGAPEECALRTQTPRGEERRACSDLEALP